MSALDIAPETVEFSDYLINHASPSEKEILPPIFRSLIELVPKISETNKSDIPNPHFRILLDDRPSASGMNWKIELSSGLIQHCLAIDTPPIESTTPSIASSLVDKNLSSAIMLKWVVAHEWMHVIRRHNDVENELGSTTDILRALEYDADQCAIAAIFRQIQHEYGDKLSFLESLQLTAHSIYWPIRYLNFYRIDVSHGTMAERLYIMILKLASLGETAYTVPKWALGEEEHFQSVIQPLIHTLYCCEKIYCDRHQDGDVYQDFMDEVLRLALTEPPEVYETWDKIRGDVARISSTDA